MLAGFRRARRLRAAGRKARRASGSDSTATRTARRASGPRRTSGRAARRTSGQTVRPTSGPRRSGTILGRCLLPPLLTALVLTGCTLDPGLRVEDPGAPAPTVSASEPAGAPDEPFSADQIREAIITEDTLMDQPGVSQVHEVLLVCTECMQLTDPFMVDGQKFQIAMVTTPSDQQLFAGVVVSESDGAPQVNLIVSGHDLTLTPGRGGTLVAQESTYREGDPDCCPSGWSVRVYRYHDGQFEPGQRISQNDGD